MSAPLVGVTGFPIRAAGGKSAATSKFSLNTTLTETPFSGQDSISTERPEIQQVRPFFTNVNCQFAPGTPIRPESLRTGGKCHEEFKAPATRLVDFILLRSFHIRCPGAVSRFPPRNSE